MPVAFDKMLQLESNCQEAGIQQYANKPPLHIHRPFRLAISLWMGTPWAHALHVTHTLFFMKKVKDNGDVCGYLWTEH